MLGFLAPPRGLRQMLFRSQFFQLTMGEVAVDRPEEGSSKADMQHQGALDQQHPAESVFIEEESPERWESYSAAADASNGKTHGNPPLLLEVGTYDDQAARVRDSHADAHRYSKRYKQQLHHLLVACAGLMENAMSIS